MPRSVPLLALVLLGAAGCAATVPMTVVAYADPAEDLRRLRTYRLVETQQDNPLLEKELLALLAHELGARAYRQDSVNPDMVIALRFTDRPVQYYVAPEVRYEDRDLPGPTRTVPGTVNGRPFNQTVQSTGSWIPVPYTTAGYTAIAYDRQIILLIGNPREPITSAAGPVPLGAGGGGVAAASGGGGGGGGGGAGGGAAARPAGPLMTVKPPSAYYPAGTDAAALADFRLVWEGTVTSRSDEPDLRVVAPLLLRAALDEFPKPSARPSRRVDNVPNP